MGRRQHLTTGFVPSFLGRRILFLHLLTWYTAIHATKILTAVCKCLNNAMQCAIATVFRPEPSWGTHAHTDRQASDVARPLDTTEGFNFQFRVTRPQSQ
ncbi:hypothetical protein FOXYSP1_09087 [Fusarium oxysporum f. sp. phaseoli]